MVKLCQVDWKDVDKNLLGTLLMFICTSHGDSFQVPSIAKKMVDSKDLAITLTDCRSLSLFIHQQLTRDARAHLTLRKDVRASNYLYLFPDTSYRVRISFSYFLPSFWQCFCIISYGAFLLF